MVHAGVCVELSIICAERRVLCIRQSLLAFVYGVARVPVQVLVRQPRYVCEAHECVALSLCVSRQGRTEK